MQRTINKKLYDTDTAELIFKYTEGCFGDPAGFEETLYRTPEGFYFLYTNGGETSPYTGEDIRRMSREKAEAWLKNLAGEEA